MRRLVVLVRVSSSPHEVYHQGLLPFVIVYMVHDHDCLCLLQNDLRTIWFNETFLMVVATALVVISVSFNLILDASSSVYATGVVVISLDWAVRRS